ncbi:E3 SUMO-protein ligase gei-17 [Caenorhabditis elegans]|uniref:E3 SUMO-protein ligase gei-17 n=1 Tax=Caenorhabditis elegans TaxID=6239 RepID=GEI17_CAEEL|nr:E3 SUMO-protein ligase gei-17 [Caenorhabditis elegans]Q94361.4 RecName: Full=E3 SUMO-protein ligase gei-17; AltName: Full=E3 SUMO-protein transferase gei-17; AltName: Full=Gex-3-interacting protein 17 [Caenorhabditis elegans]CAB02133.4 E3 SUMO-protein ligase gei-17 [Caenorhabditis elegans]|eukprot:NP_492444.4 E3 SUMO-protein ligase gei-17 [Caenorhabditis elegans]
MLPNNQWQIPINNGLTHQENMAAHAAVMKLRVHDLQSIISQLSLRKPRPQKSEHQKVVVESLRDPHHARQIYQMASNFPNGNYEMQKRPATTSQVRSHPYVLPSRSGASNHLVNHHYQQQQQQQPQPHNLLHQQMMASHHSHLQQQHHPSTVRWLTPELLEEQLRGSMRYGAPAAAAATNAPLHSSFPNHGRSSQQSLQKSEKSNRPKKMYADNFEPLPLPFYDVISVLLKPVELHSSDSPTLKQTKQLQFPFLLTAEHISKISYRADVTPLPRYELQLRFFNLTEPVQGPQKDDFPLNCYARVDDSVVQLPNVIPTNKTNAEPKRPSRPVNITSNMNRYKKEHTVAVEWLADKRVWAAGVYFVHRVNSDILFKRLNQNVSRHRSLEVTKQEVIKKLSGGEDDIAMDRLNISLLDPLCKTRMTTPSRCQDCTHLQCFDLLSYLMMNEKKPTWQCPVCSSNCPYDRLIVDDYFLDMLAKVDKNTTEVELKEDGSYDVIKEEAFCISDDDDDDVVPATVNGTASCSSTNGNGLANEAAKKKPADDDIITLSDDDDEELNRGIMNSLNDSFSPGRHTASAELAAQKTPPQQKKKTKDDDIEIITLDDTPPRPVAASANLPMRQMSQQNQMPVGSSPSGMASTQMGMNEGASKTIRDALNKIGEQSANSSTQSSPLVQLHHTTHPLNFAQSSYMNPSSGSQTPTSQYGYSPMINQAPHFQMQNGLIGRNNQMVHMQQHHLQQQQQQQQSPQIMSPSFYAQQQMSNGGAFAYYPPQYPQQQYRQN